MTFKEHWGLIVFSSAHKVSNVPIEVFDMLIYSFFSGKIIKCVKKNCDCELNRQKIVYQSIYLSLIFCYQR